MKPMAMVIKTYGDVNITNPVANTFESNELKRLRVQVGVHEPVRQAYYKKKIMEARAKYARKPIGPFRQRLWGIVGLIVLLSKGG